MSFREMFVEGYKKDPKKLIMMKKSGTRGKDYPLEQKMKDHYKYNKQYAADYLGSDEKRKKAIAKEKQRLDKKLKNSYVYKKLEQQLKNGVFTKVKIIKGEGKYSTNSYEFFGGPKNRDTSIIIELSSKYILVYFREEGSKDRVKQINYMPGSKDWSFLNRLIDAYAMNDMNYTTIFNLFKTEVL